MPCRSILLLLCAVLVIGCETTKPKEETDVLYRGASFELQHPKSVTAIYDQGDEYAVHYFKVGQSRCMMGIYEGQRPRLFAKKERDLTVMHRGTTFRDGIDRGDDAWGVDSNANLWRESVWSCQRAVNVSGKKKYYLPSMIHIWYFGATEEEQAIFDSMVDTIEMIR